MIPSLYVSLLTVFTFSSRRAISPMSLITPDDRLLTTKKKCNRTTKQHFQHTFPLPSVVTRALQPFFLLIPGGGFRVYCTPQLAVATQ